MIGFDEEQQYGMSALLFRSSRQQSFFLIIMILIMMCLVSRTIFVAIVYVPPEKQFKYAMACDQFPNIFKLLIIDYFCMYKIHIYYLSKRQRAEPWVRWAMVCLLALCILLPSTRSLFVCSQASNLLFGIMQAVPNSILCLFLMVFSLRLTCLLSVQLNFGDLKSKRH